MLHGHYDAMSQRPLGRAVIHRFALSLAALPRQGIGFGRP
jgi:hypothetical protein